MRPAIRIIFAPLQREAGPGERIHGTAQGRTVRIDPRTDAHIGKTLLHEMIHIEQPALSESAVRRETACRWRRMSWRDKADVYRLLGRARLGDTE